MRVSRISRADYYRKTNNHKVNRCRVNGCKANHYINATIKLDIARFLRRVCCRKTAWTRNLLPDCAKSCVWLLWHGVLRHSLPLFPNGSILGALNFPSRHAPPPLQSRSPRGGGCWNGWCMRTFHKELLDISHKRSPEQGINSHALNLAHTSVIRCVIMRSISCETRIITTSGLYKFLLI